MTSRQFQCRPFERQGGIGYRWPAISTGRNLCCRRGVTRHAFRSISVQQHHLLKVKNQQQVVIRSNAPWISSRPIPFNVCGTSLNCSEVVRITSPIWPTSRFTVRPWHRTDTIICICSAGRSGRRRRRRRSMANTTWPRWFISPSTTEDASGTLVGLRWLSVNAALALGWGRTRTDVPTGCEENTQ